MRARALLMRRSASGVLTEESASRHHPLRAEGTDSPQPSGVVVPLTPRTLARRATDGLAAEAIYGSQGVFQSSVACGVGEGSGVSRVWSVWRGSGRMAVR